MLKLYPASNKPLYLQVRDLIKHEVKAGNYEPGLPLPGERQLMNMYGVSRLTIRQAIGELVHEGILFRRQGSGTFLNPRYSNRPRVELYGLLEELNIEGHKTEVEVIETGSTTASTEIANELELHAGDTVSFYKRLILSDGAPLLFKTIYVSPGLNTLLKNINFNLAHDVLYDHLEQCGYRISDATQHMRATTPTEEEAKHLKCSPSSPVMEINRTTYLQDSSPVITTRAVYHNRYTFTLELRRDPFH